MKQPLLILLTGLGLLSSAFADETGWFVERAGADRVGALSADPLKPAATLAGQSLTTLRAGFRFSRNFTLSAALDEYLLDHTRFEGCLATDFVCQSARERTIDYGTAYGITLAPALYLDDDLALYGRLGLRGWNLQVAGDDAVTRKELMFGIGLGYDISNPFRLQLEYRAMDLDIKLTSIGFTWRF